MELKGEHIPKATMTSYLKDKLGKTKISTEFTEGILNLSKEYITRIANRANEICTGENKKTISLDHLYQSIEFFKLNKQSEQLRKVEQVVKDQALHKNQIKLNIQRSYEEMVKGNTNPLQKGASDPQPKDQLLPDLFKHDDLDSEDYEVEEEEDPEEALEEGTLKQ